MNITKTNRFPGIMTIASILVIIVAAYLLSGMLPDFSEAETFGIFSVIPAVFLITYIFVTKRMFEGLLLSCLIGYIMIDRGSAFSIMTESMDLVMREGDIPWIFMACVVMGASISIIDRAGGIYAFGTFVKNHAKSKAAVLLWTWVLGIIVFLDDYMSCLVVGTCISPLCKEYKISKEMLAYTTDAMASPVSILIPFSTWGFFVGTILESTGYAAEGEGLSAFIKTIPFCFYSIVTVIMVPLFILHIIPHFGPMKAAEERAEKGGAIAPEGSEKIDILATTNRVIPENPKLYNFIIPIAVFVAATVMLDTDIVYGGYVTLIVCFVLFVGQKLMTPGEYWDSFVDGIKNMLSSAMLMYFAFLFADVNDKIGFTQFMISTAEKYMSAKYLPLIIFLILAVEEFITGANWGMYVIALPIVIPVAQALGVNVPLAIGAVISAGLFGSHICFYSDCTVIGAAACGCENFAHSKTQVPYGILACCACAVLYLICGLVM